MATLPDYAEMINEVDPEGYYTILEGRCYVFPVEFEDPMTLRLQQVGRNNQDFSLRCWFSLKPMGQQMFIRNDLYDEFALTRYERSILLTSEKFGAMDWTPSKFYVNILNMQNSINFFKFLYHDPIPAPHCDC